MPGGHQRANHTCSNAGRLRAVLWPRAAPLLARATADRLRATALLLMSRFTTWVAAALETAAAEATAIAAAAGQEAAAEEGERARAAAAHVGPVMLPAAGAAPPLNALANFACSFRGGFLPCLGGEASASTLQPP